MSNQPTPTVKDSLATMLSSALSAVKANRLDLSTDWAAQAVLATCNSDDASERSQVNSTISLILMKAAVGIRTKVLHSGNIYAGLDNNVQLIVRNADLLTTMSVGGDRGVGQALALVIGGYGKQLAAAVAPHKGTTYLHTDATMLAEFLKTVDDLIKAISTFTAGVRADNPEGLDDAELRKQAATAVSNARHLLSRLFSKKMSDWEKARVLCRHALALVERSQAHLKNSFDAAEQALAANDYSTSHSVLLALENDLAGTA